MVVGPGKIHGTILDTGPGSYTAIQEDEALVGCILHPCLNYVPTGISAYLTALEETGLGIPPDEVATARYERIMHIYAAFAEEGILQRKQ